MKAPLCPSLYQINTRVWLTQLSRALGRSATLDDIPDAELDRLASSGFDWIWFLSVWRTGAAGKQVSRSSQDWRREFEETLPDLSKEDIAGSGFAITGYTVHPALGGDAALARLRERLWSRGLRLMLDFVPNHTALDNPWVEEHPDYYVRGTESDLAKAPQNYTWVKRKQGDLLLAYGRDPYFSGWPDTLQLDYSNPATQEAMIGELLKIGRQCDGVRCDMAMLVLPDVFERTWGRPAPLFWPEATRRVRETVPGFRFMAEVYWDLEWTMLQQGFDYAYDKRLYDRLRDRYARPVREHFHAGLDYQGKLARFLENHDEPRAAATFCPGMHEAAAVITYLTPGLRFFHQGQFEGRRKRISPHLVRGPTEPADKTLQQFYADLLAVIRQPPLRDGTWSLVDCVPAWDGNGTSDCFIAWCWQGADDQRRLVAVNYAPNQSQCYVRFPFPPVSGRTVRLKDLTSTAAYDRDGNELVSRGLYLDLPPWGFHVFDVAFQ
jgi:Alpha amylase, catalytic domain